MKQQNGARYIIMVSMIKEG